MTSPTELKSAVRSFEKRDYLMKRRIVAILVASIFGLFVSIACEKKPGTPPPGTPQVIEGDPKGKDKKSKLVEERLPNPPP